MVTRVRGAVEDYGLLLGGRRSSASSSETLDILDPATNCPIAHGASGTKEDADAAVDAARTAFESTEWQDLDPRNRGRLLLQLGQQVRDRSDELARLEPLNVGKPIRAAREEVFGPVLAAWPFADLDEALVRANDTPYGLSAGVWTRDLGRVHAIARRLKAGMVSVNEYPVTFPQTPFLGWKQSGLGQEQGTDAVLFYTHVKNVLVNLE